MLDLKQIEKNPELLKNSLQKRNKEDCPPEIVDKILEINQKRKNLIQETDALKNSKNTLSAEFGKKKKQGLDTSDIGKQVEAIKNELETKEKNLAEIEKELESLLLTIPNILADDVPEGKNEEQNQEIRRSGNIRNFDFPALPHWEIGKNLNILDLERGAKLTGSRFYVLWNEGAKLERALINFFLDFYSQKGYQEVWTPFMVNRKTMTGTGQLPKFEEDLFKIQDLDYFLIPTAEVPVTNLYAEETITEAQYFCCFTPCFRKEAGSYGKDTKGIMRVHQFSKVELVKIVDPEKSEEEHAKLLSDITESLEILELPYRIMLLCSGDTGFSASKCYDIEVWIPSENRYREISSVSNFRDFQARRANIKYKTQDGKKVFAHTLNGSGLAVGRTMIAILENYQDKEGRVHIPKALQPYLNGLKIIGGTKP